MEGTPGAQRVPGKQTTRLFTSPFCVFGDAIARRLACVPIGLVVATTNRVVLKCADAVFLWLLLTDRSVAAATGK